MRLRGWRPITLLLLVIWLVVIGIAGQGLDANWWVLVLLSVVLSVSIWRDCR